MITKKPVMIKADQTTYEDLGWKDNGAGRWTAYDREDTESGYERLFDDEQIAEKIENISDETKKQAYKEGLEKLYVNNALPRFPTPTMAILISSFSLISFLKKCNKLSIL